MEVSMKKMYKRIFSIFMALVIMLGGSVAASAANPSTQATPKEEIVSHVSSGFTTYKDNGIMTLSTNYIDYYGGKMSQGSKYSTSFTLAHNEHIVTKFNVSGKCHIKITVKKGLAWATYTDETVENNQIWDISNAIFDEGTKVYITVTSSQNDSSFTLQMWGE